MHQGCDWTVLLMLVWKHIEWDKPNKMKTNIYSCHFPRITTSILRVTDIWEILDSNWEVKIESCCTSITRKVPYVPGSIIIIIPINEISLGKKKTNEQTNKKQSFTINLPIIRHHRGWRLVTAFQRVFYKVFDLIRECEPC